jgi:hypothetical protein
MLAYAQEDRSLLHVISLSPGWTWEVLTMVRNILHRGPGKAGGAWVQCGVLERALLILFVVAPRTRCQARLAARGSQTA